MEVRPAVDRWRRSRLMPVAASVTQAGAAPRLLDGERGRRSPRLAEPSASPHPRNQWNRHCSEGFAPASPGFCGPRESAAPPGVSHGPLLVRPCRFAGLLACIRPCRLVLVPPTHGPAAARKGRTRCSRHGRRLHSPGDSASPLPLEPGHARGRTSRRTASWPNRAG